MQLNSTGHRNTATGAVALNKNTTGYHNTGIGTDALRENTTGFQNTALGYMALVNNTTGDYNTAIGVNTGPTGSSAANLQNTTCVGIDATVTASNQVRIGNAFVTSIGGQVGWSTLSDARFKENVQETVPGLAFITKLRPVTYQVNRATLNNYMGVKSSLPAEERNAKSEVTTGFLAQEVEQAAHAAGFDFSGVDKPKNDHDLYGLRYAEFVVPLVKAVQEQQEMIEELKNEINKLQSQINQLNK